jgi:hypothetical protein
MRALRNMYWLIIDFLDIPLRLCKGQSASDLPNYMVPISTSQNFVLFGYFCNIIFI